MPSRGFEMDEDEDDGRSRNLNFLLCYLCAVAAVILAGLTWIGAI